MFTKSINYKYESIESIIDYCDEILKELLIDTKIILNDRWVFMDNKKVFYDNEVVALFPDLNYYKCNYINNSNLKEEYIKVNYKESFLFEGLKWDFITLNENMKSFKRSENYPFKVGSYSLKYDGKNHSNRIAYATERSIKGRYIDDGMTSNEPGIILPIHRLNKKDSGKISEAKVLKLWIENNLIPKDTDYNDYYKTFTERQYLRLIIENDELKIDRVKFINDLKEKEVVISLGFKAEEELAKKLLECDKLRADIEKYDEKILTDPNRGHWDIWKETKPKNKIKVNTKKELIARNPISDIKEGGVVGIDFGTKSTIVVHQEDSEYTLPMRVGVGQFRKAVDEKHYENPTVMEFINLNEFINNYKQQKGRPLTKWEDLTISHTAFDSLLNSSSENYYAYFSELKQWCGTRDKRIRIKDKNQNIFDLPTFLELKEDELNPIEIYAYYLGLYINNMHNGIYLDYILSFPVTYEKDVREKIIKSFEKGLKKSLPEVLHENKDIMNKFRVSIGASEPAAYAISALLEYGFEPNDEEKIFYGVFDFGGGTTDFDFGIFRDANQKRERKYDFVVEHFGAGGDRYLGGENLLELLAFEVFKSNADALREKGITFILPPECKKFPGSEVLLNDSQESKLNMRLLIEELRPLWERKDDYEKRYQKGIINTNLYTKDGKIITAFGLKINQSELETILEQRIEKGIKNFFECLRIAFNNSKASDMEKVHIFLAGNSSKSQIVDKLFKKYINSETEAILNKSANKSSNILDEVAVSIDLELFEIFPPLGTEQAYKKQEEIGISVERDNLKKPTGKTGVAFGLLESRPGGSIKVINMNQENDETKFKYYIGENRRKKFKTIIDPETKYNEWHEFVDAYEEDFEIYYTSLPEASNGYLSISEVSRIKCRLEKTFDDDIFVYVRATNPSCIEYVVSKEDYINKGKYLSDIVKLQLD